MTKPTKEAIEAMKERVLADLAVVADRVHKSAELRRQLGGDQANTQKEGEALASVETFVAIALRVMAGTNPSKIKDAMVAVEIQARIDGKKVFE